MSPGSAPQSLIIGNEVDRRVPSPGAGVPPNAEKEARYYWHAGHLGHGR